MASGNNEDQNFRGESNKNFNFAIKQMENVKGLEFLNNEVIDKLDKASTPYFEMAILINLKS